MRRSSRLFPELKPTYSKNSDNEKLAYILTQEEEWVANKVKEGLQKAFDLLMASITPKELIGDNLEPVRAYTQEDLERAYKEGTGMGLMMSVSYGGKSRYNLTNE